MSFLKGDKFSQVREKMCLICFKDNSELYVFKDS